ncbi:hypothetical protein B0T26DRAFT_676024 [Lasiosphaeria miniovina]|uniref:Uncharacterized protein n=1 Tax=Lasiosphaeria miniovina TaxID=1954250 RepID=A0AA40AKY4_9PEZI|nr:uncharacterized protein B0T26DRAFT_676024 [Lasiosphaeria miniovina]KAK0717758.1 hypothetical protein B0T26DRAFT_676024 [Lasiosphaeria miniovina]
MYWSTSSKNGSTVAKPTTAATTATASVHENASGQTPLEPGQLFWVHSQIREDNDEDGVMYYCGWDESDRLIMLKLPSERVSESFLIQKVNKDASYCVLKDRRQALKWIFKNSSDAIVAKAKAQALEEDANK